MTYVYPCDDNLWTFGQRGQKLNFWLTNDSLSVKMSKYQMHPSYQSIQKILDYHQHGTLINSHLSGVKCVVFSPRGWGECSCLPVLGNVRYLPGTPWIMGQLPLATHVPPLPRHWHWLCGVLCPVTGRGRLPGKAQLSKCYREVSTWSFSQHIQQLLIAGYHWTVKLLKILLLSKCFIYEDHWSDMLHT